MTITAGVAVSRIKRCLADENYLEGQDLGEAVLVYKEDLLTLLEFIQKCNSALQRYEGSVKA